VKTSAPMLLGKKKHREKKGKIKKETRGGREEKAVTVRKKK